MSSTWKEKVHDLGLTEVYCSPNPQVDVVLVHGLNGHPYNTWATHEPEVFWPADLLPSAVEEQGCRILTYGYDANVAAFTNGASKDHIHNHAEQLAGRLVANRSLNKARERPIIFVAHSLGGLVVKRLLIYCESINNPKLERLRSIYVSTFGILFLGTPHNGSDLAKFGSILQSIAAAVLPRKLFDSSPSLVNALRSNNETLQNINRLFIEIMDPLRIYFFHEQKPMDLKGTRQFVVEEDSAAPLLQGVQRMGIEKDHSNMCKFEDINAPGFDVVADAISSYAEEAPPRIALRWDREKRVREYYRQTMAGDLLGDHLLGGQQGSRSQQDSALVLGNTSPADSYIIEEPSDSVQSSRLIQAASSQHSHSSSPKQPRVAPLLFRPNSIFVGFDIELEQLKHKLASEKKTKIGTCAVVICGPPGSGKSHLARQYVWNQQADYPAGIFWVDCKSKQSIDRYYWDIGQALGCLEGDRWNPAHSVQSDGLFVQEVRKHLEAQQGWIIVFDGIFFDSYDALSNFVEYLPDSPGNSIIYTSIDPTLRNRHRLLSPSWIRMRPLDARAARSLLFKSLGMHSYTSTQLRKANELIRYYKCLPLGIHAAAHMLEAQGRALEKFSPTTSDKRLANPFLEIIRALERRGYVEAINLLALLSLLNHKVPVVLLHFGISSLVNSGHTIESLDRAGGMEQDIDNTISVLLRYGLVERELQTCSVSSPGHKMSPQISRATTAASVVYSSPTVPGLPEDTSDLKLIPTIEGDRGSESSRSASITIDTLRVHSITQVIVREEMKVAGIHGSSFDHWLLVACRFLEESYRKASTKLGSIPGQGSVADYREYKTQVTTLWKYMPRSHKEASASVAEARENLRNMFRTIQEEINKRSPSQSQSSHDGHFKYIGSVFETSASSSDEDLHTPTSGLTRTSTWSSGKDDVQSESPTQYHTSHRSRIDEGIPELDGYTTELDDLTSTLQSSQRWSVRSDTTEVPVNTGDNASRQALLQAILRGHSDASSKKNLGEFKPMPTIGKVSRPRVERVQTRSSSVSSTRSSAEAALAAVQARDPSAAVNASENRKPTADSIKPMNLSPASTKLSLSLDEVNSSSQLPIIAASTISQTADSFKPLQDPWRPSKSSTSPRLINAVLARQAARYHDELPVEDNITITRRYRVPLPNGPLQIEGTGSYDTLEQGPSGYMSVPMSRDVSRESHISLESAPTEPLQTPQNLESEFFSGYGYRSEVLPSIDVAMARSLDMSPRGSWAPVSPIGIEDDLPGPGVGALQTKIVSLSAPTSAPSSPHLESRLASQSNLDVPDLAAKGKERAS